MGSSIQSVITTLIYFEAAVGNAVVVFVTFLISIPAMVMPMTRGWLKFHGYMTVVCALYTMILGLIIWFETLKTRKNLAQVWLAQPASSQSLLQQEVFFFALLMALTNVCSSIAVDMRIVPHHHSSLIPHVPTRSLLRIWEVVSDHYLRSEITSWTWSSRELSVSLVRSPSQSPSDNLPDKKRRRRRPTHPHDINFTQGSQGEGKIPTYR